MGFLIACLLQMMAVIAELAPQLPPPPTTTVVTQPLIQSPVVSNVYDWYLQSDWPQDLWPIVQQIIQCESSGNPQAFNGHHRGLMQVDPDLWGPVPSDPVAQLNQGYHVYLTQGWGAWECYLVWFG